MTQVLARKWRPRRFEELVGQEHVVRALANALEQQRLHHAYLFTGTRGVGKTTLARLLAKALNCERGVTASPCGECTACREIDAGRFVDLIELDAASNTQVDNMRELLENALYAPVSGRCKVYIIDEVHMLSRNAFNAMLKTLEEPPEHVKFVLATTDPQKIPVTVLSRCLQFNLKRIPPPLVAERLRQVLEAEGVAFEPAALQLLARAAQGSLRDGLSLLDQAIAHGGGKVEEASVRAMLGAVEGEYLYTILKAVKEGDGARLKRIADDMEACSVSFEGALQDLASMLTQVALAQAAPEALGDDTPQREQVLALARLLDPEEVQLYYQIAVHGRSELDLAPDEYAGFTMTLLRMLAFAPQGAEPGVATRTCTAASGAPAPAVTGAAATGPGAGAAGPGSFSGLDWAKLTAQLQLTGMARQLAEHCELASINDEEISLCVPEAHRYLLDKRYEDRVAAALRQHFGRPLRVKFSCGGGTGLTPAEMANRERRERQLKAIEAIEKDPFVRELIENFDARLVDSSIKPLQ
ncbi:MAG: DNA polymerase III subunit gamma/tau [Azospira oryzae]|nr:MAG: DNA polymerase III subunit gamma/tau [Azospira oryzae]PZP83021.1 MAG: DNA polymerase III subunit gamma/tau [Azospira oryzae]